MARADRIMSALVPVMTTVVTTAMSTVITVAHTRRGARSIVAAASGPTDPNIRAVAAVALTMGAVSAKPSAISAVKSAKIAMNANVPRCSTTTRIASLSQSSRISRTRCTWPDSSPLRHSSARECDQ